MQKLLWLSIQVYRKISRLIGGDTNLQRKAEALAAIDQAMALQVQVNLQMKL